MAKTGRPKVSRAVLAVDARIQTLTAEFTRDLNQAVMQAQANTLAVLQRSLTFNGGKVATSPGNRKAVSGIAATFLAQLRAAGYDRAVMELVYSMPGLTPYFQETLNAIFETLKMPPPRITFTPQQLELAAEVGVSTRVELNQAVSALARQAQAKALFSFGAVSYSDLAVFLSKYTGQTVTQGESLASTGLTTYYRTIADLGFKEIEEEYDAKYVYDGPDDAFTRPFCHRIMQSNRPRTRREIEQMDNGQMPDVMRTCGGYRCRHQWVLWVPR